VNPLIKLLLTLIILSGQTANFMLFRLTK